jgi:large subunit ribosomal protein L21
MYAIFRAAGRQYRAEKGAIIDVDRLPHEVGETVEFDEVLLVAGDGETQIGKPLVEGASIKATVVDQFRGKKVIVWKYIPKERYRRKKGHRQHYTRLRVEDINA